MSDFNQRQIASNQRRIGQTEVREVPFSDIGASVYRAANQAINTAANTAIQFTHEEWDTAGFHDNATNNTRLTMPYAGKYLFEACVQFATGAGTLRYILFQVNGSASAGFQKGLQSQQIASAVTVVSLASSAVFNLGAGDYVELIAFQDSGGALNVTATNYAPWFQVQRLP